MITLQSHDGKKKHKCSFHTGGAIARNMQSIINASVISFNSLINYLTN